MDAQEFNEIQKLCNEVKETLTFKKKMHEICNGIFQAMDEALSNQDSDKDIQKPKQQTQEETNDIANNELDYKIHEIENKVQQIAHNTGNCIQEHDKISVRIDSKPFGGYSMDRVPYFSRPDIIVPEEEWAILDEETRQKALEQRKQGTKRLAIKDD